MIIDHATGNVTQFSVVAGWAGQSWSLRPLTLGASCVKRLSAFVLGAVKASHHLPGADSLGHHTPGSVKAGHCR